MKTIAQVISVILLFFSSSCFPEDFGKWELIVQNDWSIDLDVYISTDLQTDPFEYLGTVKTDETVNEMGYFEYLTTYYLQGRSADGQIYDEYVILTKDETVGESCVWVMKP